MTTKLAGYMVPAPDSITLTEGYNTYIESLVSMLRNDPSTREIYIEPETGFLFRFDLTSFLLDNGVPLEDQRLVMRINGISSAQDMDEYRTTLLIPNNARVASLKQIYRTSLMVG